MALHADPVAEDRTAGERRVGVGRKHCHRAALFPQQCDHSVHQRRLPGAGRAGETDNAGSATLGAQRLFQRADRGIAPLDHADRPRQGADVAGSEPAF